MDCNNALVAGNPYTDLKNEIQAFLNTNESNLVGMGQYIGNSVNLMVHIGNIGIPGRNYSWDQSCSFN